MKVYLKENIDRLTDLSSKWEKENLILIRISCKQWHLPAEDRPFDASAIAVSGSKRAEPRVPFGQLVERGMLRPGEELVGLRNHKARVRADGTLVTDGMTGSIHQVGALLEHAPSCNGWTYWHFVREGQRIPIDLLRQQIRAEMEAGDHPPN